jgi:hypothetical protein
MFAAAAPPELFDFFKPRYWAAWLQRLLGGDEFMVRNADA